MNARESSIKKFSEWHGQLHNKLLTNAPWISISSLLLLLYLIFFHLCLANNYWVCVAVGIACWLIWSLICFAGRKVFINRFEYAIHQIVGLDILIEGFVPLHEGYGFYFCAASFWAVFLSYRFLITQKQVALAVHGHEAGAVALESGVIDATT